MAYMAMHRNTHRKHRKRTPASINARLERRLWVPRRTTAITTEICVQYGRCTGYYRCFVSHGEVNEFRRIDGEEHGRKVDSKYRRVILHSAPRERRRVVERGSERLLYEYKNATVSLPRYGQ